MKDLPPTKSHPKMSTTGGENEVTRKNINLIRVIHLVPPGLRK